MEKTNQTWEKDGYTLRLARESDVNDYYEQNYNPLDADVARLTGCKTEFSRDEVVNFLHSCIQSPDRYDFLILDPEGRIVGESVINEIDWEARSANYRICIFQPSNRGCGIGYWAVAMTRDFAFRELKLHRLELDVYSFNQRAQRVYLGAGFRQEGVLRDAVLDGDAYGDTIIMSILEDEWRKNFS